MKNATNEPLSSDLLQKMNAYWRAANYLSVGQIYLYDNPLLKEPLKLSHVKPLVVGHWGTTPGQNFIYVHFSGSSRSMTWTCSTSLVPATAAGRRRLRRSACRVRGTASALHDDLHGALAHRPADCHGSGSRSVAALPPS